MNDYRLSIIVNKPATFEFAPSGGIGPIAKRLADDGFTVVVNWRYLISDGGI